MCATKMHNFTLDCGTAAPTVSHPTAADTLEWRKQNEVDSYLFRKLSPAKEASLRRHQHNGHIGVDKQGRPIYLEMSAQTDIPGMTANGVTTDEFVFASVRQMEYLVRIKLPACQKAAGRKLEGHIVISVSTCNPDLHHALHIRNLHACFDLPAMLLRIAMHFCSTHITLPAQDFAGASLSLLSPANLKIFKTVAKLYADHYPEFMVMHATPSCRAPSTCASTTDDHLHARWHSLQCLVQVSCFVVHPPMIMSAIWRCLQVHTCPLVNTQFCLATCCSAAQSIHHGISTHLQLAALMLVSGPRVRPGKQACLGMAGVH